MSPRRSIAFCSICIAATLVCDFAEAQFSPPGHNYGWVGHDGIYDGTFASSAWLNSGGPGAWPGPSDAAYFNIMQAYTIVTAGERTWGTIVDGSGVTLSGAYNTFLVNVGGSGALVIPPETLFKAEDVLVGVDSGTGSIQIRGQMEVSTFHTRIGAFDLGSIEVLGPEGEFIARQTPTTVGDQGAGFLHVENGGVAKLRYSAAGQSAVVAGLTPGTFGFIQVYGMGSRFESDAMTIGKAGEGEFEVAGGAHATVEGTTGNSAIVLAELANSSGDLRVQQEGSLLTIPHGGLEIGRRGLGDAKVVNGGAIEISGNAGLTSLLVGTVNSANGSLLVSGAGSTIDIAAGALEIGRQGMGRVDILGGGHVTIQHDANSPAVLVGTSSGGKGRLEISGENSRLIAHGPLELGRGGEALLIVQNKGAAEVEKLLVGSSSSVPSHAFIDGAGSSLKAEAGSVDVGTAGRGLIDVLNKGQLVSQRGSIGLGGEGTVTIRDEESQWRVFERLTVGANGKGTLSLVDGGAVLANEIVLGSQPGSEGHLFVDGADSRLTTSLPLTTIGEQGRGTLTLRNGAQMTQPTIACGIQEGSDGVIFVEGFGTSLEVGPLLLGSLGRGYLTVRQGGHAEVASAVVQRGVLEVGFDGRATLGTAYVGMSAGDDAEIYVAGGTAELEVSQLRLGGGGTARLAVYDGAEVTANDIRARNANIHLQGNASAFSELTANAITMGHGSTLDVWENGIVRVSSALILGNTIPTVINGRIDVGSIPAGAPMAHFRVGPGGYVSSNGEIPSIRNLGGTVHVGNSPGTMTITGDYIQDAGVLQFSVAGTTAGESYSQLVVNGSVQLQGVVELVFEDGFAPLQGQSFDLFDVEGESNMSTPEVRISNLAEGFLYDFAATADGYRLTALNDGIYTGPARGDFDEDGHVNGDDFLLWQRAESPVGANGADLAKWKENFGLSASNATISTTVPEASSFALMMAGGLAVAAVCRRCTLVTT